MHNDLAGRSSHAFMTRTFSSTHNIAGTVIEILEFVQQRGLHAIPQILGKLGCINQVVIHP